MLLPERPVSTVNIPESLIERAKAVTGQTRREAAIRAAIELAEAAANAKPAGASRKARPAAPAGIPSVSSAQLLREERKAGGKRFADPAAAKQFLRGVR